MILGMNIKLIKYVAITMKSNVEQCSLRSVTSKFRTIAAIYSYFSLGIFLHYCKLLYQVIDVSDIRIDEYGSFVVPAGGGPAATAGRSEPSRAE